MEKICVKCEALLGDVGVYLGNNMFAHHKCMGALLVDCPACGREATGHPDGRVICGRPGCPNS